MKSRRAWSRGGRGYTLVELMMALALLSVSVLGIISLQKVTVVTNAHAKNLALAQRIAQSWAGQLEMDATEWVSSGSPTTAFLSQGVPTDGMGSWRRLQYNSARSFGAAFDALGNPLPDANVTSARFCSHVRLSWLYPTKMSVAGNGTLRAEIRVFWLRDGEAPLDSTTTLCSATQSDTQARNIGLASDRYHFVYQTVGVRQHSRI